VFPGGCGPVALPVFFPQAHVLLSFHNGTLFCVSNLHLPTPLGNTFVPSLYNLYCNRSI
jgi:hypothetical protein